jgi:seryl-tRNA synthetase
MEAMVKEKKKAIRSLKKQQADPTDKKAEAKRLQEQLRAIKTEVKEERAKAREGHLGRPNQKRPRCDEAEDDDVEDDDGLYSRPEKRVLTAIDKWQKGHRRAALTAAQQQLVQSVTVGSWEEASDKMQQYGWAVVDNFTELMHPACRPDADMRDYILDCT